MLIVIIQFHIYIYIYISKLLWFIYIYACYGFCVKLNNYLICGRPKMAKGYTRRATIRPINSAKTLWLS